ncbi:MAG: hypothetical protein RL748_2387, partial [Pseudomonadota bacterium]
MPSTPAMLRPAPLFLLFTYLLLSAVPFGPYLIGKPPEHPWHLLFLEVWTWAVVWAVCKRPAWFHWMLLPAFLALPTEIYLQIFYGQGISTHHLGIIAETSPTEALEFLGKKIWPMIAIMLFITLWFGYTWRIAVRETALDWSRKTRITALLIASLLILLWSYGYYFGAQAKPAASASASSKSASQASASKGAASNGAASITEASSKNSAQTASHSSHYNTSVTLASTASGFGDEEEEEDAEEEAEEEESASGSASQKTIGGVKMPFLPWWADMGIEPEEFAQAWPYGLMTRGIDFYKERQYLADLSRKSRDFKFGARQEKASTTPEVVVMVIGESARYDRWSLNGYERNTNPLLSQEKNLITLPDVITSVAATRLSVPVILSRKPAIQSLKDGFSEKSFLTAYKEAGFKTWWLSNQISFGHFDTPVSVFAKEADVLQFLNLGGFTNDSNFDQVLLSPFSNALRDPAPKKLIVLHTLGNHWNYSHRYPKHFDKWQPSLFGVNKPAYTDLKIKPALNNSYDNSILYTDWFLAQVIDNLKKTQQLSSMMYVADHGQTLYDGTCNLAFHGHNTQFEFHVPAMIWYSDQYLQT